MAVLVVAVVAVVVHRVIAGLEVVAELLAVARHAGADAQRHQRPARPDQGKTAIWLAASNTPTLATTSCCVASERGLPGATESCDEVICVTRNTSRTPGGPGTASLDPSAGDSCELGLDQQPERFVAKR